MDKGETIVLRVSSEDKATIKAASQRLGQSITTFMVSVALKRARQIERSHKERGVHGGVPSFFKASCFEASQGGTGGYASPGWHLAAGLGSQQPDDLEFDEWADEIEALEKLLADEDDDGVLAWFDRHYPKCMALVPPRRRNQFLAGVRKAYDEDRVSL